MAMIRSQQFRERFFYPGSRPSEKEVRRWVQDEEVPGKITESGVWIDPVHFATCTVRQKPTGVTRPDLTRLYNASRRQAEKRGISWDLTWEDLLKIWDKQAGRCSVSGIRFSCKGDGGGKRRPWFPSIDRKDSAEGYTPQNVRLVCVAANLAMNEWGEDVLIALAHAVSAQPSESKA